MHKGTGEQLVRARTKAEIVYTLILSVTVTVKSPLDFDFPLGYPLTLAKILNLFQKLDTRSCIYIRCNES